MLTWRCIGRHLGRRLGRPTVDALIVVESALISAAACCFGGEFSYITHIKQKWMIIGIQKWPLLLWVQLFRQKNIAKISLIFIDPKMSQKHLPTNG